MTQKLGSVTPNLNSLFLVSGFILDGYHVIRELHGYIYIYIYIFFCHTLCLYYDWLLVYKM
jgi:hypothetical protein